MRVINPNLQFRAALTPLVPANVRDIIIHHIAGTNRTAEQIHQQHLNKGWLGAGYNEYIRKDGTVYIMRGDHVGAQTQGYNSVSYGIGCEGNYQTTRDMPSAQFTALVERCIFHLQRFPNSSLARHSDRNPTLCPGQHFPWAQLLEATMKPTALSPIELDGCCEDEDHWAADYRQLLIDRGIAIHEKRFGENITRGESFALMARLLKAQ